MARRAGRVAIGRMSRFGTVIVVMASWQETS
jgi:hypothetical protein